MKSLKNLVIPIIFLVLLVFATLIWLIVKPNDNEVTEEADMQIFKFSLTEIDKISVLKTDNDAFTVNATNDPELGVVWSLEKPSDNKTYSQDSFSSWATILTDFKANSLVTTNATDLEQYGLQNPERTVAITLNDGSVHYVYLGNMTNDSTYVYFAYDDKSTVYTISNAKVHYADFTEINFINTCVFNVDYNNIQTVQFDRNTEDSCHLIATCEMQDTGKPDYHIIQPFNIDASDWFRNLIDYVAKLEVSKFVSFTDEEIKTYGLDNPTFHFLITMLDGTEYELYLSQNIGGYFYGYTNITDGYFSISELQIDYLETPTVQLLNSYINYFNASVIKSITYSSDDVNFNFEISTKSAIGDDDAKVTIDLRQAKVKTSSGRTYAALLFETLSCIKLNGIELDINPEYVPVVTIKYCYNNYSAKTYGFVERDDYTYYVFLDGEYTGFYVLKTEFTYDNGADLDGSKYGIIPAYNILNEALLNELNGIYDIPSEEA